MGTSPGLRRSRENRWIAGVCGGIAERFGLPPGVVRLAYAVVSILSTAFPGTLFYVILWVCVPEEDPAERGDDSLSDAELAYEGEASHLSRSAALALALLLGVFGAHRFYAGRIATGVLMLLTLGGLGIWWLVDLILVATGEFRDVEGRRIAFWEGEDLDEAPFLDSFRSSAAGSGVDSSPAPALTWDEEDRWPASQQSTSGPDASSSSTTRTT